MTEDGIIAYGLADGFFCEDCGRPKLNRLLMIGSVTGCPKCDEVTTRHRCTKRPVMLPLGESWECPDCGSTWTVTEQEVTCGECGTVLDPEPGWSVVTGDR